MCIQSSNITNERGIVLFRHHYYEEESDSVSNYHAIDCLIFVIERIVLFSCHDFFYNNSTFHCDLILKNFVRILPHWLKAFNKFTEIYLIISMLVMQLNISCSFREEGPKKSRRRRFLQYITCQNCLNPEFQKQAWLARHERLSL